MADENPKRENLAPSVEITIKVSAEIVTQGVGEHFRAYAIITAQCGDEKSLRRMMLPGPYQGLKDNEQLEEFRARWQSQLEWIGRNISAPALSLADSLIIKAYQDDEGVNVGLTRRKLQYTQRQAERFRELLPDRERFWNKARRKGLGERTDIWQCVIAAFEAKVTDKKPPRTQRPKYRAGQIALLHAAMDAGVMLRNYEQLSIEQWRTVKRELVDRK